jgi:glycerol-3-phosphate dehydrogenase subunit B
MDMAGALKVDDPLRAPKEVARRLEADDAEVFCDVLVAGLRQVGTVDHLVIPPIMGFTGTRALQERLTRAGGTPVSEWLSLPPSVPGERLQHALDVGVAREGVEVVEGEAVGVETDGHRVTAVSAVLRDGAREVRLCPGTVVLCTGKYLSGGIRREERFFEPLLGLPVFIDGQHVTDGFVGDFVGAQPNDEQPFMRAGVLTNARLQPLNAVAHQPMFANVYAAGSILSGYDVVRHRSGMGVAAVTGLLAGRFAAEP